MASSTQKCGVCDLRHINKPSIIWCTECDEGLCQDCQEHHGLSKGTRNHNTLAITEYQTLPSDVLQITQYCSTHEDKFIMYCRKHERPCCRKCIVETHKECPDIDNLEDVIQYVKTSNAVNDIEETLVEIAGNLKKISQHQQKNLLNLKEKRKQIEKEIQKTRTTINNHLDKLQEDLMKKLNAIEETQNSKICQLLSSLGEREKEITKYQENFASIKQHASELQIFLSLKQIEKDIDIEDKFLQSIVKGEELKQCHLEYKTNMAIQDIMSNNKIFGEVQIENKPCDIVLSRRKTKQAQIMVPTVQTRSIVNIKLKKNKTIATQGQHIFGCCLIPDGRMAFTYYYDHTVRVFSDTGLKDFQVNMPCKVDDILYISKDDTLAVTSGGSRQHCIFIINVGKKQITRTILQDSEIDGIALRENELIYSGQSKGIQMINLSDESITQIVKDKMPGFCYIATFRNQIYHTNPETYAVTCYDQQGKPQWTFKNESLLKEPHGIDVDIDGNVYVAGSWSNNVVVVSPDRQHHREVLTASDGLIYPNSLCYDNTKKKLLVANYYNEARLYDFI
ncbi:Hypothetical predicted protein [Mytilus galloprovincialis]|uniref:B box-type domain-containing protein n=1 Tax=Mytilus galloprovincialis TaxID=29158 RepID=A0A8B6CVZ8_MYTGA|nr:Hypothetical predicted protein [Mytilus galloprovincialis]